MLSPPQLRRPSALISRRSALRIHRHLHRVVVQRAHPPSLPLATAHNRALLHTQHERRSAQVRGRAKPAAHNHLERVAVRPLRPPAGALQPAPLHPRRRRAAPALLRGHVARLRAQGARRRCRHARPRRLRQSPARRHLGARRAARAQGRDRRRARCEAG